MMETEELERLLRWEENWFASVQAASPTRLIALRLMRHAIWYLRSRRRSANSTAAW